MSNKKVFSWDVETNGLTGQAFAIAAVVYENGCEVATFSARCNIKGQVDSWVAENVIPQMKAVPITHSNYEIMLCAFAEFFLAHKEDADVIFHMGVPVEARVIIDMHDLGILGPFDGAYPWLDIAGVLLAKGFDPTSVDSYNKDHEINVPACKGGTHNPLYDSRAAALCYMDLMK